MAESSKERIAAALALAEAVDAYNRRPDALSAEGTGARYEAALEAYRATDPKLRAREQVDTEIVDIVRGANRLGAGNGIRTMLYADKLAALCREPTQADAIRERIEQFKSYGSSSDRVDSPPRVDAAAGATFLQPWECSQHKSSGYGPIGCPLCRAELSGPRPTPATKESSDTAGVEAGAANRITDHDADQREAEACSCEESEALKAQIAVLRAKISDCANHAQGGLGHGKYPSCSAEAACRWIYQRLTNP